MPELPDVEVFKRYFDATALHHEISKTEVTDDSLLGDISSNSLARKLKGRKFQLTDRYGKYLFAKVNDSGWLILHFGMTGFLKYFKNDDEAPDHIRMLVHFTNGYRLAYDCQRKLGLIDFTKDLEDFIKQKELGKDPFRSSFRLEDFKNTIRQTRGGIKAFLMNQKWIAGIGNIYSDEILFHAGIHPEADITEMNDETLKNLYSSLKTVLKTAVNNKVNPAEFPQNYLLPHREDGEKCPKCSGTIQKKTVNGRSSYFCNKHQKK